MMSNSTETNKEQQPSLLVSVVIPILNEEKYIDKCIQTVLCQDFDHNNMEVILVDGMSEDKTVQIIEGYQKQYAFIRLLQNPGRTVQLALNIGMKAAFGTYIVRMDAHSEYADNYISKCVEYLEKTGADNVGGPMIARGKTDTQKAIAAAYHSAFALGGGKFHEENYEGYADTVYLGSFKRETIKNLGYYDERFPRSEDDELNYRLTKSGGKVFITPEIKSVYYPRSSLKALFKQYFEYGVWKVAVIKKYKKPARLSHLVPLAFILFLIIGAVCSFFSPIIAGMYGLILLAYLLLDIYYSFTNTHIKGIKEKLLLIVVHFYLHISYGLGFLCGIFKFISYNFNE